MAVLQSIENQPHSYGVFDKKHDMECTTRCIRSTEKGGDGLDERAFIPQALKRNMVDGTSGTRHIGQSMTVDGP
jgi:hypothetical protein